MRTISLLVLLSVCLSVCLGFEYLAQKHNMPTEKYIPIDGGMKLRIKSVAHATKNIYDSYNRHDLFNMLSSFDKNSYIVYNSILPTGGVYRGVRGAISMIQRIAASVHLTDSVARILFADEARGTSAVLKTCSGVFRHNNATFNNISTITFIKWELGKIKYMNIVDIEPTKLYAIYQTKAEARMSKINELMYSCGDKCNVLAPFLANDIKLNIVNLYPQSSLIGKSTIASTTPTTPTTPTTTTPTTPKAGGSTAAHTASSAAKENRLTVAGKEGFAAFANVFNKFALDFTLGKKVLYADDNTIVSILVLKPTKHTFYPSNKYALLKSVTNIYCLDQFNNEGLLTSVDVIINRPLLAWNLRYLQNQLKMSNEEIDSALAPLRKAISSPQN